MSATNNDLPQLAASQSNKELRINELLDMLTGGGSFARDPDTSTALTWGYLAGMLFVDGVWTTVAAGTVTLTTNTTNYVERTRAGVVSTNTTGFTAGLVPLYTVETSAAGAVDDYTDHRVLHREHGVNSRLSKSVAGSADVTLTAAEARCEILNLTGVLTGDIDVIVPNGPQKWIVSNNTTGSFTLTVKTSAGTGVEVDQSSVATLVADGTNVIAETGAGGTVSDGSITNAKLADMAEATIKLRAAGTGTGAPIDGTAAEAATILQGDGLTVDLAGFRGIPQTSFSANTTIAAAHHGRHLYHPASDANARTLTIDSNTNLALPIGFTFTAINDTAEVVTIAITTDTLVLAGAGTTGSRSLAQYGVATAIKVTSTRWIISGTGLT